MIKPNPIISIKGLLPIRLQKAALLFPSRKVQYIVCVICCGETFSVYCALLENVFIRHTALISAAGGKKVMICKAQCIVAAVNIAVACISKIDPRPLLSLGIA